MPISVVCECGAKLNAPDTSAGKRVKCPKCATVLTVPTPEDDFEMVDDEPAPPKKRPTRVPDDDEDDDRPVKRRSWRDEEEDEEDDDRPRPKKKKKGKKAAAKSNLPLILGIGGGVLAVAVIGVVLAVVFSGKKDDTAKATGTGGSTGGGGGGGAVVNQPKGPPAGWQEFSQPEFTAYFPGGNAPQDLSAQAQAGVQQSPGTTVKMFILQNEAKDNGYMVIVWTHPPNVLANIAANKAQAFDEAANRIVNIQPGTRIQSQTPVVTAGHDGVQYQLRSEKDVSFMRVFMTNQRLYLIVAEGTNATENDTIVKGFFDNFQPK